MYSFDTLRSTPAYSEGSSLISATRQLTLVSNRELPNSTTFLRVRTSKTFSPINLLTSAHFTQNPSNLCASYRSPCVEEYLAFVVFCTPLLSRGNLDFAFVQNKHFQETQFWCDVTETFFVDA